MTPRRALASLLLVSVASSGCTHWGTTTVLGPRREVSRRAVGQPRVEELTSSDWGGGFGASGGGSSYRGTSTGAASGVISGGRTVARTQRCVQATEITYSRTQEERAEASGRAGDYIGGGLLSVLGVLVLSASNSSSSVSSGGVSVSASSSSTTGNVFGGLALLGGVGLIAHGALAPSEASRPQTVSSIPTWQETSVEESTGCGALGPLAPEIDVSAAPSVAPSPATTVIVNQGSAHVETPAEKPAARSPADRIRALDGLRKSHVITEAEYQARKKAILDAI